MSKYLEYLIELLERFYTAPDFLMEDEAQILLRLIRKAHQEHTDDLNFVLTLPEENSKALPWLKECQRLTEKHTNETWEKYYELIEKIEQQPREVVSI